MVDHAAIIVVEDDEAVRDSLKALLESNGLAVEAYSSGREFMDARPLPMTGCAIFNLDMPGMGGLEVLESGAISGLDFAVILVTGRSGATVMARAARAGAVALLEKPLREEALVAAIEDALASGRKNPDNPIPGRATG